MERLLFIAVLALLFIHEMDAIRVQEWKMFIVLKDMNDETAYKVFTIIHLPLYFAAVYTLVIGGTAAFTLKVIVDIFLLGHTILHFGFRNHRGNGFTTVFSKVIIFAMPILACGHLFLLLTM